MKYKSTKKASDIVLQGITVEIEQVNTSVTAVILRDEKGQMVKLTPGDYSGMGVYIPAPPEMEKKWKLSGAVLGLPVEQFFPTDWEAKDEQQRLERACREESDYNLKVEQVEVPVAA